MSDNLELERDYVSNVLINNQNINLFVIDEHRIGVPHFYVFPRRDPRKSLIRKHLGQHHKILGLFLDRPQEVAVMSEAQRRDFKGVLTGEGRSAPEVAELE
ncbi:MAG: hypothetical protein JJE39_05170 [Vicinamibacteria bacterium]|nr:hypothetical protein [Vicinamibacteria bacterium]